MGNYSIAKLWFIFAAMFGALAIFHFWSAYQASPHFVPPERPFSRSGSVRILGMDLDAPMKAFATSFNAYVDKQNESSKAQNLASMVGYILACLTALFSFILEVYSRHRR
jgi:hypothetical protein